VDFVSRKSGNCGTYQCTLYVLVTASNECDDKCCHVCFRFNCNCDSMPAFDRSVIDRSILVFLDIYFCVLHRRYTSRSFKLKSLLLVYDQQMHTCLLSDHHRIMINFIYVTIIVYIT
jgi:hypothetical protein